MVLISVTAASLLLFAAVATGTPNGTLVWSDESRSKFFVGSAQSLPSGDVIMIVEPSLVCFSHVTGEKLWETSLGIDDWTLVTLTVAVDQSSMTPWNPYDVTKSNSSLPIHTSIAVVWYQNFQDGSSFVALDVATGKVVMPNRKVPLSDNDDDDDDDDIALAYSTEAGFMLAAGTGRSTPLPVTAVGIPSGQVLFNMKLLDPIPEKICQSKQHLKNKASCLAVGNGTGCLWFEGACQSSAFTVGAIATVHPQHQTSAPASARASPDAGSGLLGLVGTIEPAGCGEPFQLNCAPGTLYAIEASGRIRWSVKNTTVASIFVVPGIALVQLAISLMDPARFTKTPTIRGYSLADGTMLWERSLSKQHTGGYGDDHQFRDTGEVVMLGPYACEVACGVPCSLVATSNASYGAINPKTGTTEAELPAPSSVYATAGGIEYAVSSTMNELTATECSSGALLWSAQLPGDDGRVWQKAVVGAPLPLLLTSEGGGAGSRNSTSDSAALGAGAGAAAAVVFLGGEICTTPTPRGCQGYEYGAAAILAPSLT
jgi:outer membrane protein assembly factor BamB